jgi:hypothetical protein
MTQFINNIHENVQRPNEVTAQVTVAFKKSKATKCSHHSTQSKEVVRIQRRTDRKIEDTPGYDQFGFRTGKGTNDARFRGNKEELYVVILITQKKLG